MRKLLSFVAALLITSSLFAGGLVTNTNQSATWVRLPSRNASTEIDAAYFNPAGLMKLDNGLHISLSNQSIFQTRKITNNYSGPRNSYGLNVQEYEGSVKALVFPTVYAAYKLDKLAFSLGFGPVGGGGGAIYKKGLPSFEMSPSDLVPSLAASQGASEYALDAYFEGTSTFFGFQGGISYKISEMVSVAVGLRYISAKNTYEGYLRNIEVNITPGWTRADVIMTGIAANASNAATSTSAIVSANAAYGNLTLAQAQGFGIINATQKAQLEGGLTAFGSPTTVTIAQADAVFKGAAAKYTATAAVLGDQAADVSQSGSGITPFFSMNLSPSENLNIAIKYEMATKLELKNKTIKDFTVGFDATGTPVTMFPNGLLTRNDMPAMLSVGLDYRLIPALKLLLGANYFFDKSANYGHKINGAFVPNKDIIANNGLTFQGGLEFNISEKFLVSGGYIWANKGVNDKYQSDLTYGLGTQTFGAGGAYNISDKLQINLGASYTKYMTSDKVVGHIFSGTGANITSRETYEKGTFMVGIGLNLSF